MIAEPATVERQRYRVTGLHAGQQLVARSNARFRVVVCGRRWGKTRLGVALSIAAALSGARIWWVAPTYPLAMVGWRELRRIASKVPGADTKLGTRTITFPGGGSVQVRTASTEGGLRGEGLDGVVYDEAAWGTVTSWEQELRPALSDRKGWALFISSPRGRANWVYELWQRGVSGQPHWESWQFPTASNPTIAHLHEEVAEAESILPLEVFEQEYLAQFTDSGTSPFRPEDVDAMADGWLGFRAPQRGHRYLTAWDIGRRKDATVGVTIDLDASPYHVVAFDRAQRLPFPQIQTLIEKRAALYDERPIVESNGMGDPVIENLQVAARPWLTTMRSKVQAIQALQGFLERGLIKADIPHLSRELKSYEWDDRAIQQDCVMALAIAAAHLPPPGRDYVEIDASMLDDFDDSSLLGGLYSEAL